ncbi:hypothetical protein ACRRTK_011953 [Alexandromys fortis]
MFIQLREPLRWRWPGISTAWSHSSSKSQRMMFLRPDMAWKRNGGNHIILIENEDFIHCIVSVSGLDKEADLVHMEVRTTDGYAHYLTCRIQECAETTRSGPFARSIDISSLVVQDEYIFIQGILQSDCHFTVTELS